ncbi:MAG: response regulator, partial [Burkholderiaceae bacterium]
MNRYLSDPDRHPMAPGSPKILLVDDQDHNLIAREGLLAGRGWTLLTARSGAEALVQLQRHDDVAAIVLDLRMPGMDGFETAARIRAGERTRPTPIIFVTAAEEAGDRERAFRFAAADFVRKPFNALELPAKVGLFVELYQRSELRYRTLFEAMDEGYCLIEMLFDDRGEPHDYRFLEANPAFELQTGLVDAVGKTVRDMAPGHETHWFRIYGDVARTGRPTRFVQEARQLGRWYDVYAVRMGADGSDRVAVLFKDITEDKRVQDELRRVSEQLAAQDRTKNEFIATLAHELRAPLAPLRSALEVMKRSPGDAGRIERMREMMERQLTHLVHLVDDLLDIGRVANGKLQVRREPVDVAGIISRAVEATQPLIHERGHGLDLSLPRTPLIVSADRTRMAQVIGNLLTNAAKYTP